MSDAPFVPADDPRLAWIGRIEQRRAPPAARLAWSGSELRARFTGGALALHFEPAHGGPAYFELELDGQATVLAVPGPGAGACTLPLPVPPGPQPHALRLAKRTEAAMAETWCLGLTLAPGGQLLAPPPPRPWSFVFYGDSITAGACNADPGDDQFEDASTHDGMRAYGALAAARLAADYLGIAVSGTGLTASWHDLLLPQVWDRVAARLDAAVAPHEAREPDLVFVNLGQNDHGFPASQGQRLAPDFGARHLDFARALRRRHPQARLVLAIGGMPAWREEPALPRALADTAAQLRAEGDTRVWTFTFEAGSATHPRLDVHARMADELVAFLRRDVLR